MEIISDWLSVHTTRQICVLIFIWDNNYDTTISKVGFQKDIFSSVNTKWYDFHEIHDVNLNLFIYSLYLPSITILVTYTN